MQLAFLAYFFMVFLAYFHHIYLTQPNQDAGTWGRSAYVETGVDWNLSGCKTEQDKNSSYQKRNF